MKTWKVTAEVNMCAEHYESVIVRANTERKALKFANQEFLKKGFFFITNTTIKEIMEDDNGKEG